MNPALMFGLSTSEALAKRIAEKAHIHYAHIEFKRFPDHEMYVRFAEDVRGRRMYLVLSLNDPDEKITELLFVAHAAREMGVKKITLIAPYLAYMRADKQFRKGEVISARVFANILGAAVDELITIDPHLHRIKHLREIYSIKTTTLSAVPLLAKFIKKKYSHPIIMGPDEESYQWALRVAKMVESEAYVLKKRRLSSVNVRIKVDEKLDVRGKEIVIVDDIISTGHTMARVITQLKRLGAKRVDCCAVHGVFANDAYALLKRAGAADIVTTNAIENPAGRIDVSGLIAESLKR